MTFTRLTVMFIIMSSLSIIMIPGLNGQEKSISNTDCSKVKKEYLRLEQEWSEINAGIGFLRSEQEKLHGFRWDSKIALSVLNDALKIINETGKISSAQRMILNSRITNNLGTINIDGTFTFKIFETASLEIKEAVERINSLLSWAEEDIQKAGADLLRMEEKSHRLNQNVKELEMMVEKKCDSSDAPTLWEQGISRVSSREIYQRYVEKEKKRQNEVDNRREDDIARLWVQGSTVHGSAVITSDVGIRYMLIRLSNTSSQASILRCFPFRSSWDKRWILDELDQAIQKHEHIPGVGALGEYQVIDIFEDTSRCHEKLF